MAFGMSSFGGSSFGGGGIRDGGFGLNFNQGFGSRGPIMPTGPSAQQLVYEGGNQLAGIREQGTQQRRLADLNNAANTQQTQIQADASKFPSLIRDRHFNQLFPLLRGQFNASLTGGDPARAGGQSGQSPEISVGPVLNDQQIQQQVNASRASTDATTANQQVQDQRNLGGRGFGSNSPLLQMLSAGRQMAGNAQNTDQERQLRFDAANTNADAVFKGQMGRESQFASRQQEDIARRIPVFQQQNAILAALAGLI